MGQVDVVRGQPHVIIVGLSLLLAGADSCALPQIGGERTAGEPRDVQRTVEDDTAERAEAEPARDEQALAVAAQQMSEHDPEKVVASLTALPKADLSAKARYLLARAFATLDRHGDAADALPADTSTLPQALRELVPRERAQWLAQAQRCEEALSALTPLTAADVNRRQAALVLHRARCEERTAQPQLAITSYERVLELDPKGKHIDRIQAQMELAQLLSAQGQQERSVEILRSLYIHQPADRRIPEVKQRLLSLTKADRTLGKPLSLTSEEASQRAQALFDAKAYEEAATALKAIRPPKKKADQAEHLYQRGMALFRSRKHYPEAAKVFARAARLGGKHERSAAFHAARALARADRDRAAVKAFARFIKKYRHGPYTADAAYLQAWLSTRHRFPGGRQLMTQFIAGRYGRRAPRLRTEGQFQLAMDAFQRRRFDDAHKLFTDYADGHGEMVRARGLYWAAQAATSKGHKAQAKRYYEEIRRTEPLNYYAQLATLRLQEAQEDTAPMLEPLGEAAKVELPPLPELAAFYLRLGLIHDASSALRMTEPGAIRRRGAALEDVVPWAARYSEMGEHHRAYQLVGSFWSQFRLRPALGLDHIAWNLSYARPVPAAVTRASERFQVPQEFIYAIMRKESAFQSQVVSYADAIGLLQLLPETAATLAVALGELNEISDFDRRRLLQPAENVWLGAAYLAELSAHYPQHPALAIAAYNAGAHQVDAWLRMERPRTKRAPFRLDLFVERIPITQTRNYVRRVLTNWACYRYLQGEARLSNWPLTL